jgi:hypothetical protein
LKQYVQKIQKNGNNLIFFNWISIKLAERLNNKALETFNSSNPNKDTIININNNSVIHNNPQNNNINYHFHKENYIDSNENLAEKSPIKYAYTENKVLKQKFLEALSASKNTKKHFQVVYMFKKRIKRMFRIDCMTRKINV